MAQPEPKRPHKPAPLKSTPPKSLSPKKRRYALKDYSHPQVRYWATMSGMLWWAAAGLGAACMIDSLHQAFSCGLWRPYWPLYYLYYPTMTAYAGAREREKWVRGAQRYEEYTGEFFVYGWLAIALFIFAGQSLNFAITWPVNLFETMAAVWGVYLGVKVVGGMRPMAGDDDDSDDAGGDSGDDGDDNDGGGAQPDNPAPNPAPQPTPTPSPAPGPVPGPAPAPTPAPDPTGGTLDQVAAACRQAGTFTAVQIAEKTGLSLFQIHGYISRLVVKGVVKPLGHDAYHWVGEAAFGGV